MSIIKIQCCFRKFIARRELKKNKIFKKSILGYHLLNENPIKETDWEDIQENILKKVGIKVLNSAKGSHKSGKDIETNHFSYSNKTSKIENKNFFSISSYRLTSITTTNKLGKIDEIIKFINEKKNFDKYSILLREEKTDYITYYWIELPANFFYMEPINYEWKLVKGKILRNRDIYVGWETNQINNNSMKIVFSMSSQLWINLDFSVINEFIKCRINANRNTFNSLTLDDFYDKFISFS